jgi:hypothetical protein
MQEKNSQSSERAYRVVQIEGKVTWSIEELWEGGAARGPFGSKAAAIQREEDIARAEGFIDGLVLKEAIGGEVSISDAVEKDSEGNWHCLKAIAIEMDNRRMVALPMGMTFTKGVRFLGIDVAEWLDEHFP